MLCVEYISSSLEFFYLLSLILSADSCPFCVFDISFQFGFFVCLCVCSEVLKNGSSVHPALLKKEVEAVRDRQRSPLYCDQLLEHISSLPTEPAAEGPE